MPGDTTLVPTQQLWCQHRNYYARPSNYGSLVHDEAIFVSDITTLVHDDIILLAYSAINGALKSNAGCQSNFVACQRNFGAQKSNFIA
jgi:hypothetical protein